MTASAIENPGSNLGIMVPQPHGGAIKRGNTTRVGRRPDRIRKLADKYAEELMPVMAALAQGTAVQWTENGKQELISPTPGERATAYRAITALATKQGVVRGAEVRARIRAMLDVIQSRATWETPDLLERIDAVWGLR